MTLDSLRGATLVLEFPLGVSVRLLFSLGVTFRVLLLLGDTASVLLFSLGETALLFVLVLDELVLIRSNSYLFLMLEFRLSKERSGFLTS